MEFLSGGVQSCPPHCPAPWPVGDCPSYLANIQLRHMWVTQLSWHLVILLSPLSFWEEKRGRTVELMTVCSKVRVSKHPCLWNTGRRGDRCPMPPSEGYFLPAQGKGDPEGGVDAGKEKLQDRGFRSNIWILRCPPQWLNLPLARYNGWWKSMLLPGQSSASSGGHEKL